MWFVGVVVMLGLILILDGVWWYGDEWVRCGFGLGVGVVIF